MPVQDNSQSKKADEQVFESEEEKRRQTMQNTQENNVSKSQKLLPFLNVKAESHQNRIDNLNEKIAARKDKIVRNETRIEKLSAKADRLEDRNTMLKNTLGNIPAVRKMIEANERKIADIRENKIPDRLTKIKTHQQKIEQFSNKRNRIEHKLNRVLALNDAVKSFSISFNKERREVFTDAMDRLNAANTDCLTDKLNALNEQKAQLSEVYSLPQTSAVDKYNLQAKINGVNEKISGLEDKIHKLSLPKDHFAEQTNDTVDATMKVTADKITEFTDNSEIGMTELANAVLKEADKVENLDLSEIANLADNFNYGSKAEIENLPEETIPAMDGNGKINPDYYKSLSKNERHIESMTERQAEKVMTSLNAAGIAFSAVSRANEKTAVTVAQRDVSVLKDVMQNAQKTMEEESKIAWHELGDDFVEAFKETHTINPDYYKSLTKENRFIGLETKENAIKVMAQFDVQNIPYSAVDRKNGVVAVTVAKENESTYKEISNVVKRERAVQFVNPDFFKALPKEARTTQRMSQENAEQKISELSQKNIPYSAVLNGSKSAVTVEKKDSKTAFFSRDKLMQSAQKISTNKSQDKNKTNNKNQGLE